MKAKSVIVNLPPHYQASKQIEVAHEEEALSWLWAYPEIFIWKSKISWLYTPVVGNKRWPGDLWGIDADGDLLIIEAKRSHTNDNAFIDFVDYHNNDRTEFFADHWEKKWLRHYKNEIAFNDSVAERPAGRTDGILPRSNKRKHIRLWRELGEHIGEYIRTSTYRNQVHNNLNSRRRNNNPLPYYFALMIDNSSKRKVISDNAIRSAKALAKKVGDDHVAVRPIQCIRIDLNHAHIENAIYEI